MELPEDERRLYQVSAQIAVLDKRIAQQRADIDKKQDDGSSVELESQRLFVLERYRCALLTDERLLRLKYFRNCHDDSFLDR